MITLLTIILTLVVIAIIGIIILGIAGAGVLFLFGDLLAAIFVIWLIIKLVQKIRK